MSRMMSMVSCRCMSLRRFFWKSSLRAMRDESAWMYTMSAAGFSTFISGLPA